MSRRDVCILLLVLGIFVGGSGAAWWNSESDEARVCSEGYDLSSSLGIDLRPDCPSTALPIAATVVGLVLLALGAVGLWVVMLTRQEHPDQAKPLSL